MFWKIFSAIILLVIGFVLLIKGADFFVDGCSVIARKFGIPSIVVGLTVVAMGTSLPETAVSLISAINGANELSVSNATGSNLMNIFLIVGICGIIRTIRFDPYVLKRDFPLTILSMAVVGFLISDSIWGFSDTLTLGRIDGILLLVLFAVYLIFLVKQTKKARKGSLEDTAEEIAAEVYAIGWKENIRSGFLGNEKTGKKMAIGWSVAFTVFGACCIAGGGELVVNAATTIAEAFGMSETLIGLTIAAIGTSLPELVTSIAAVSKGEDDMAVGNCIGSCIFNALFVLGISCTVMPITVSLINILDILIFIAATVILYVISLFTKRVNRGIGIGMVVFYISYLVYIIMR